jgi:hypothetical protein
MYNEVDKGVSLTPTLCLIIDKIHETVYKYYGIEKTRIHHRFKINYLKKG